MHGSPKKFLVPFLILAAVCFQARGQEDVAPKTEGRGAILHQQDNAYLLRHNPFYFAYGNPVAKLQLSFRTKPVTSIPIYMAYTQLLFWRMQGESMPFHDITFNPEIFYRQDLPFSKSLKTVDMGWMHDSNGKEGASSRSYNSLFVRLNAEHEYDNWIFRLSLTAAYLHAFDDGNGDYLNFGGPFTLKFAFIQLWESWIDKGELALQLIPGGKFGENWNHGGYQVSYAFRLGKLDFVPSFYLQYYTGYAESLLNYNQYVHAFRAGIIF